MNLIIDNKHNKKKCQKFTPLNEVKDMLDLAGYTYGLFGKTVLESIEPFFLLVQVSQHLFPEKHSNNQIFLFYMYWNSDGYIFYLLRQYH